MERKAREGRDHRGGGNKRTMKKETTVNKKKRGKSDGSMQGCKDKCIEVQRRGRSGGRGKQQKRRDKAGVKTKGGSTTRRRMLLRMAMVEWYILTSNPHR